FDRGGRDKIESVLAIVSIDPGARAAGVITQRDEAEPDRTAALPVRVAIPMKIIIVYDRLIECRAVRDRQNDRRCRLDHRPRRDRLARKHPAAAPEAGPDFNPMVRKRHDATT